MRFIYLKICVLSFVILHQSANLSAHDIELSILTCSGGDELYSAFGHTALRARNVATGDDIVYNFGGFDFDTPNFYLRFIKGDLDYFLIIEYYNDFIDAYTYWGRVICEQKLLLSDEQTDHILVSLSEYSDSAKRVYRYKFIERNCTTEVRDIIMSVLPEVNDYITLSDKYTYRYYLSRSLVDSPWIKLGVNLLLGANVDKPISHFESMFLPELLSSKIKNVENDGEAIVSECIRLNDVLPRDAKSNIYRYFTVIIIFIIVLLIVLFHSRYLESAYFFILGVLGLLFLFLMLYSSHMEFNANYNVLWCNPLFLIYSYSLFKCREKLKKILSIICIISICILFFVWMLGLQKADMVYIIVAIGSLVISLRNIYTPIYCKA